MAKTFTTLDALAFHINSRCQSKKTTGIIETELKQVIHEHSKTVVQNSTASKYPPRITRGVDDINVIKTETILYGTSFGVEVSAWNAARPAPAIFGDWYLGLGDTTFARWINDGLWMDLKTFLHTGMKAKRPARSFMNDAIHDIKKTVKNSNSSLMQKIKSEIED